MSQVPIEASARVEQLRQAFDESFAVARRPPRSARQDLLLVRMDGRRYGIRVSELRGLHEGRRITPLPSISPPLLGITGIRGELVAAYSLAGLLDCNDDPRQRHWHGICETSGAVVALVFSGFEGCVRVADSDLHSTAQNTSLPRHTCAVARLASDTCYVISTESILKTLTARWTSSTPAATADRRTPIQHGDA